MNLKSRQFIPVILTGVFIFNCTGLQAAEKLTIEYTQPLRSSFDLNVITKLDKNYLFKLANKVQLPDGKIKYKFIQFYLNVPIWGVSLTATQGKSGEFNDVFGTYLNNIEKDLTSVAAKITKQEAMKIAVNASKLSPKAKSLITNEEINIYILQDKNEKAHLVYIVSFMVYDNKPTRPHFIIDANDGRILEQWEGLTTKDAIGPGGNEKTGQYNYGTDYGFLTVTDTCQMDSSNVETWDMKNLTSGGAVHQFDCSGNPPINTYRFINGAYSPINDAHFFGNVVFNMYKAWFNKSPLIFKLRMRVHYSVNYQNAFWDGRQMTFGDGATTFYPLTGLDVVGHEVSHGFTEQNSNLIYSKQPGGINESFSDIAGEASEYFNNPNRAQRNDWLVGAEIIKRVGGALRYFDDPTRDGRSIGHAKDYYDGLDVHYSSGVFNKAFYTLAHKTTWNTEKAFRAFVLANQIYWNQSTDFTAGGCGVMKAAKDLGFNAQDVIDAFNVVGVNANCAIPPPPTGDVKLTNGVPVTNLSAAKNTETFYYIDVPAGMSTLTIKTAGGTGDVDMYVHFVQKPTTTSYLCRPYTDGNDEVCTFKPPSGGRYYIMLRGYLNYTDVSLTGTWKL